MTQPVIQTRDLSRCYQIRSTTLKPCHSLTKVFADQQILSVKVNAPGSQIIFA